MDDTHYLAASFNRHSLCQTRNNSVFEKVLISQLGDDFLIKNNPYLFSQTSVYISKLNFKKIEELIIRIENVISTKAYKDLVLKDAPAVALKEFGPAGVFMGYDFHITESGPQLIEINTNAGGGLLNLHLARAQSICCDGAKYPFNLDSMDEEYFNMFVNEWRLQRGDEELRTVAIVDINPLEQYLYSEFRLFSNLFEKYGLECLIADPSDLERRDDGVWIGEKKIDLIYNRLTDFYFENKTSVHLLEAYEEGSVVITPNPYHHALYANKHNLELLCQIPELTLGIPFSERVTLENQDDLWENRRHYFFKPSHGYGSKAAYRGDKMTLRVWSEIKNLNYVAQKLVKPEQRIVKVEDTQMYLKQDMRAYVYQGRVQLLAARLYSGQTTNFRTLGGGFAPVFLV